MEPIINHGQLDSLKQLNGIGRQITNRKNLYDEVNEGQFKDGLLDGFGRSMRLYTNGELLSHIGHYKSGRKHGYGVITYPNGVVMQGLF